MMMIEMELVEIEITGEAGPQIIILQEKEGTRNFPIFIGNYEVMILDQTVRGFDTSRPLTHDLILNVLEGLGGTLTGVLVDELRNDTFIGKLLVRDTNGEIVQVDTRPSDAIILAMKTHSPIYVAEEVLEVTNLDNEEEDEG
jgi:bifunctional DNase/RNase